MENSVDPALKGREGKKRLIGIFESRGDCDLKARIVIERVGLSQQKFGQIILIIPVGVFAAIRCSVPVTIHHLWVAAHFLFKKVMDSVEVGILEGDNGNLIDCNSWDWRRAEGLALVKSSGGWRARKTGPGEIAIETKAAPDPRGGHSVRMKGPPFLLIEMCVFQRLRDRIGDKLGDRRTDRLIQPKTPAPIAWATRPRNKRAERLSKLRAPRPACLRPTRRPESKIQPAETRLE